jgi:uncharacterized membrane protein
LSPLPKYPKPIFIFLTLMYFSGVIGLHRAASAPLFQALTPLNLMVSLFFLIWFCPDRNRVFWLYCIVVLCVGFSVEVLGVKTGLIFGRYWYGQTLGTKLFNVPLTIGLNWLMLNYTANVVADKIATSRLLKSILAALLMTSLDILIEPVAMQLDFWDWANHIVPLQNYAAWFVVSLSLSATFFYLNVPKKNQLAGYLFLLQILFFALNQYFV